MNRPALVLLEEALGALPENERALRAEVMARLGTELYYDADPRRGDELTRQGVALAEEAGDDALLAYALSARHYVLTRPDVEPALRLAVVERVVELSERSGARDVLALGLQERISDLLELGEGLRLENSLRAYERVVEQLRHLERFPRDQNWIVSLSLLAPGAGISGDPALAQRVYELLSPYAGRMVAVGHGAACDGAVDHQLGVLAVALGDPDLADEHFGAARALHRQLRAPLWLAHTRREHARPLEARHPRRPRAGARPPGRGDRRLRAHGPPPPGESGAGDRRELTFAPSLGSRSFRRLDPRSHSRGPGPSWALLSPFGGTHRTPFGRPPQTTIVPGGDPYPDLVAFFPVPGSGVALSDTEACLSGLVGGEAFVACDGVLVRLHGRRCGLGFELALVVPLLARLRRRRAVRAR